MTGTTNGVKEFDQGENLGQSSDMLAVIDIYGLSDLAKIGHGYAKELEEEHYFVIGRGTMAKRHSDELAHERRRAKIPRTSRQGQPDQLRLGRRSAVLIMVGDRANASCPTNQSLCAKFYRKRAQTRNSSS